MNVLAQRVGSADKRISAKAAGYMELAGAVKDADCHIVNVPGGVASERGCCNKFQRQNAKVIRFHCGGCEYVKA